MFWKQVEIETKYRSLQDARENMLDVDRITILGNSFSNKIAGTIDENGRFKIVTTRKNMAIVSYDGYLERRGATVWMVGQIRPRMFYELKMFSLYGAVALFIAYFLGTDRVMFSQFSQGVSTALTFALWVGLLMAYSTVYAKFFYKFFISRIEKRVKRL